MEIKITLPDDSIYVFKEKVTGLEIAKKIFPDKYREILALQIDDNIYDLNISFDQDAYIKFLKWDDKKGKEVFWHSSAHLMAAALEELYPGIILNTGPAIEKGFYYDINCNEHVIDASQISKIEAKMMELSKKISASFLLRKVFL